MLSSRYRRIICIKSDNFKPDSFNFFTVHFQFVLFDKYPTFGDFIFLAAFGGVVADLKKTSGRFNVLSLSILFMAQAYFKDFKTPFNSSRLKLININ